eukprot:Plantae.Rhodophyta-Hildenbrandia_rubra.ctg13676.p2 GENE.Plantae.Rhodophyta-Hildenbrandia_rubra.ctg13676~~Plantae.Rhodophyta-Hildenbrandia_rubra.ctg13676.p2  ORF type:complete len:469 (+),score=87.66 Plantae.Rhodophyta-Hildenbrandia_rubra.ctg13676:2567-3973(+)
MNKFGGKKVTRIVLDLDRVSKAMAPGTVATEAPSPNREVNAEASPKMAAPTPTHRALMSGDPTARLKWYYSRLFPIELFCRWLSYGSTSYLSRREMSFTLAGDIYLRYRSYAKPEELLNALKSSMPIKIDIGAVYNYSPKDKGTVPTPLTALEKELVFDIDMTDYVEVMGNGAGGSEVEQCDRNWRLMATAVKVMTAALQEDFGFEHILWVYSGRRGIHCWVADERARKLNNEQRSAVADYLYLRFEGRENAGRRQYEVTAPLHPALLRAKHLTCDETFREFMLGFHGILDTPERMNAMLRLIPDATARANVEDQLARGSSLPAQKKWARIEKELQKVGKKDLATRAIPDYLMFRHTYPRLDVNVSKDMNHLLKAPFCVHPKTGRVCVPFRAEDVDSFIPGEKVPTIESLIEELGSGTQGASTQLLRASIAVFEEFVKGVEQETRVKNRRENLERMEHNAAVELISQF